MDYYQHRHVIGPETLIDGGVYLSSDPKNSPREAIVVDSEKYPAIRKIYNLKPKQLEGFLYVYWVYDIVLKIFNLPPEENERRVTQIIEEYGVKNNGKIALDVFIDRRAGVCRHMALLAAVLLELGVKDGILEGTPRVVRNKVGGKKHVWCIFYGVDNSICIIDPGSGFLGYYTSYENFQQTWKYKGPYF